MTLVAEPNRVDMSATLRELVASIDAVVDLAHKASHMSVRDTYRESMDIFFSRKPKPLPLLALVGRKADDAAAQAWGVYYAVRGDNDSPEGYPDGTPEEVSLLHDALEVATLVENAHVSARESLTNPLYCNQVKVFQMNTVKHFLEKARAKSLKLEVALYGPPTE